MTNPFEIEKTDVPPKGGSPTWADIPRLERYMSRPATVFDFETKSSGAKDEFEGGGVRDAQTGKPRFDLLRPLNVPYGDQLLTRWAALMARGAEHYGDRNWERMSDQTALDRFKSSAARHFEQWLNGEVDEDHAAATFFNVAGAEYIKGVLAGRWAAVAAEESS